MSATLQEVRAYYDANVADKLRDFVEGNARIERAWSTIEQWAPGNLRRILEIGCGIGHVTARLAKHWPAAEVTGVDVSPRSLEVARSLFTAPGLRFVEGPLQTHLLEGTFDMIVLLDVYEHVAIADRGALHQALAELLYGNSRTLLSFPTPRALAWSREFHPHTIQPIEEDIRLETIQVLARDLRSSILSYQEVNVWHEGDYAHAVLGTRRELGFPLDSRRQEGMLPRLGRKLAGSNARSQRLALVHERLGKAAYPG
jgi:2-polyprenyl-3-methyl-5-hydroxy-6-metoxy-1,4-benzoquinol methylase